MDFYKIYNAAIKNDTCELKQAIKFNCIDESLEGSNFFSTVSLLAKENNITAVEFLIHHGAQLSYAGRGAALGGHIKYAESLISRGANINCVAQSAAVGGHIDFAESLISRGADIAWVVLGAAIGGHKEFVENLIKRDADITWAAQGAAAAGNTTFAEELISRGADITWVAQGAAYGGYIQYAENLIARGANITWVARSAATGGLKTFAEDLISRGADINWVARGAAMGGHQEFSEDLILKGANIDWVARGAAIGGHSEFAEALLLRGADINWVARGAALGGYKKFTEDLIARGANINHIVWGAFAGKHITKRPASQLSYLTFYHYNLIPTLVEKLQFLDDPILIPENIKTKAIALSKHMHKENLNYAQAILRSDPSYNGMLYLLMLYVMKKDFLNMFHGTLPQLLPELWNHIFKFISPIELNAQDLDHLGFVVAKTYLCAQLSSYQSGWVSHKERAHSFYNAISATQEKKHMLNLICEQTQILQGNNPYSLFERDKKYKTNISNQKRDKYHSIVSFWEEMRTNQPIIYKEERTCISLQCFTQ